MHDADGAPRREQVLEALHATTRELVRADSTERVGEIAVEAIRDILGMPITTLWLYDGDENILNPVAWTAEAEELLDEMPVYTAGGSLSWDAFESGEVAVYRDLDGVDDRHDPGSPVRSEIIVPLGEHGVVNVGSTEPDAFDEEDVSLARLLGANVEAALEHTKRAEQLRGERDRFRAVFDGAFDAMLIADDDGRYVDANESACELFGLPKEEVLGRSVSEFAPDDYDFEGAWNRFRQSDTERGTFPLRTAGGERRTVEYAATTDVTPGEHLSILRDVTDRERRERALEHRNERLESFASLVSHDLRNPLTVAAGRLDLARESHPDDEDLATVGRALDRMEELIADILTLARTGNATLELAPADLGAVARDAWETVQTVDATLTVEDDVTLLADEGLFRQVLENLFRNAVEHGGDDVAVRVGAAPGGFYVEDDGPGVPEGERTRAFDAGHSTADEGTGFGLAIVSEVTDAHGWSVSLVASADGGARFEFGDVVIP